MLPLVQILIYLCCVAICYKAVEIFQLAWVSDTKHRRIGLVIGVVMLIGAGVVSAVTVGVTEYLARTILDNLNQAFPGLR